MYGGFYVTGVGAEANKFYKDLDGYQQKLHQLIEAEPIGEDVKRAIQRNVVFIKYYDKDVVLMKITRSKAPIKYAGKIYIRKLANTDPEPISDENEFAFLQNSSSNPAATHIPVNK